MSFEAVSSVSSQKIKNSPADYTIEQAKALPPITPPIPKGISEVFSKDTMSVATKADDTFAVSLPKGSEAANNPLFHLVNLIIKSEELKFMQSQISEGSLDSGGRNCPRIPGADTISSSLHFSSFGTSASKFR